MKIYLRGGVLEFVMSSAPLPPPRPSPEGEGGMSKVASEDSVRV